MGELSPCPFCGSIDVRDYNHESALYCHNCGAIGPPCGIAEPDEFWNRRTPPPATARLFDWWDHAQKKPNWSKETVSLFTAFLAEWPEPERRRRIN